jgi:hypothetical protein
MLFVTSCNYDNDTIILESFNKFSLYWKHEVFGEEGRRFVFGFTAKYEFNNSYEMKFNTKIDENKIEIFLSDLINEGKCPKFPTIHGIDSMCQPKGTIYIPESILNKGTYDILFITHNFSILSQLIVDDEIITLNVPDNQYLDPYVHKVYPIPKDILWGSIGYNGIENEKFASKFIDDLISIGLQRTTLPDYPYEYFRVDSTGNPCDEYHPPDRYYKALFFKMNNNFTDIYKLAEQYHKQANEEISISVFTGNGEQAHFSSRN